jgi:hypothetical protein
MIDNDQDTDQMRGAKSTDFEQTISFRLNVIWTPQTGVCGIREVDGRQFDGNLDEQLRRAQFNNSINLRCIGARRGSSR